jgi:lipopolysaccharide/colanic/teichoic acid biosynthesis glycosyltransferase
VLQILAPVVPHLVVLQAQTGLMYVHRVKLYTTVQLALDCLSLCLTWVLAAQLRVLINPLMKLQLTSQDKAGWVPSLWWALTLWLILSWRLRLYRSPQEILPKTILSWAGANALAICSVTIVSVFFSRESGGGASRMFVLCLLPVMFLCFVGTRSAAAGVIAALQHRWQPPRIALIGDLMRAGQVLSRVEAQIGSAIRGVIIPEVAAAAAVGHYAPVLGTAGRSSALDEKRMPVLGTTGQIAELVNRENLDRVIVLTGSLSDSEIEHCNRVFWRMGLPVSCTLDLPFEVAPVAPGWRSKSQVSLFRHDGLSIVEMRHARFPLVKDFVKRVLDFGLASILSVLFVPVLIVIWLAIKLTSKGPAIARLPCVGKGGRHFRCYKFRTTYTEGDPALQQVTNPSDSTTDYRISEDPRITPVGRVLRRYTLDELPQLLNILLWEMSFVGPRPLPAYAFAPDGMSREFFTWSEMRARVHPGLTGLWQVNGRRNRTFEEMIRLDLEYVQARSFWLDIGILLKTPLLVLQGVGAR